MDHIFTLSDKSYLLGGVVCKGCGPTLDLVLDAGPGNVALSSLLSRAALLPVGDSISWYLDDDVASERLLSSWQDGHREMTLGPPRREEYATHTLRSVEKICVVRIPVPTPRVYRPPRRYLRAQDERPLLRAEGLLDSADRPTQKSIDLDFRSRESVQRWFPDPDCASRVLYELEMCFSPCGSVEFSRENALYIFGSSVSLQVLAGDVSHRFAVRVPERLITVAGGGGDLDFFYGEQRLGPSSNIMIDIIRLHVLADRDYGESTRQRFLKNPNGSA